MSANCRGCSKTVYPMEKLVCLDSAWHKTCFKCTTCNTILNMKTYKCFDKLPYCASHYPSEKFTVVAQTPATERAMMNSKQVSQVAYRKDFEKSLGQYHSVADDLETQRHKANSEKFSSIKYHSDFEKSKGSKISVSDDPLLVQQRKSQQNASLVNYKVTGATDITGNFDPPESFRDQKPKPQQPPLRVDPSGVRYHAMYEYEASDEDEVSFRVGDIIMNVKHVDSGWMMGTVERTGRRGLLPANYVDQLA